MGASRRRVVITGVGLISPLGNNKEAVWDALAAHRSGVGRLTEDGAGDLPIPVAAPAREFTGKIEDFGPLEKEQKKAVRKALKMTCRECQMGMAAAQLAMQDAALLPGTFDPNRVGVCFGSDHTVTLPHDFAESVRECLNEKGEFDFSRWATEGMAKLSPLWLVKYQPNMAASHLAICNDLRGPSNSLTLREAAANVAVTEAFHIIAEGRADGIVCGATGTRIDPLHLLHAFQQEETARDASDPAGASRPFDRDRTGMVLGEGAGAVILEDLQSARARGAAIYGEVLGGASATVARGKLVAQRDQAMRNVLLAVLRNAAFTPGEVGHVHAHGLSTRAGDAEEAWAIQEVFGDRATPVPVTAAKSYFGNLGAGSGMVEMILSLLALGRSRLFAVLNYRTPDPQCPLAVVANGSASPGASFINLSVTPQGQASAVLIRRFRD